jgi:hypothetical protein
MEVDRIVLGSVPPRSGTWRSDLSVEGQGGLKEVDGGVKHTSTD